MSEPSTELPSLARLIDAPSVEIVVIVDADLTEPNETIVRYSGNRTTHAVSRAQASKLVRDLARTSDVAIVDNRAHVGPMWVELLRRQAYRDSATDWVEAPTVFSPEGPTAYPFPGAGSLAWPEIVRLQSLLLRPAAVTGQSSCCVYMKARLAASFSVEWLEDDAFQPCSSASEAPEGDAPCGVVSERVIVGVHHGDTPRWRIPPNIRSVPPAVLHIGQRLVHCEREKRGYSTHRCLELALDEAGVELREYATESTSFNAIGHLDGDRLASDGIGVIAGWLDPYSIELVQCALPVDNPYCASILRACNSLGIPLMVAAPPLPDLKRLTQPAIPSTSAASPDDEDLRFTLEAATVLTVQSELEFALGSALCPHIKDRLVVVHTSRSVPVEWSSWLEPPVRPTGPLRILVQPMNLTDDSQRHLARLASLTGDWVEWHVLGECLPSGSNVIEHRISGPAAEQVMLKATSPDLVFTDASDTARFLYSCSRFGRYGLPLVAIVREDLPQELLAASPKMLFSASVEEMARRLIDQSRSLVGGGWESPPQGYTHRVTAHSTWVATIARATGAGRAPTIGYVVHDRWGNRPGSAHVRVLRRAHNANIAHLATVIQVNAFSVAWGLDRTAYDAIIVQRDAVHPDIIARFIKAVRARGIRLVLEIDDDLITSSARQRLTQSGYSKAALDTVATLARTSDAVITSTANILTTLKQAGVDSSVIPNEIDDRLWAADFDTGLQSQPESTIRVLYMGSTTHDGDLKLLQTVFDSALRTAEGVPVELDVLGVTPQNEGWYRRVPFPPHLNQYPDFVQWLREHRNSWTLAVAPLVDTPFNASKSDLKFLEYSMLNLPTIASNVGPYRSISQHGGYLVSNDPDEWRDAILKVISKVDERRLAAQQSSEYVSSVRTLQAGGRLQGWVSTVLGSRA